MVNAFLFLKKSLHLNTGDVATVLGVSEADVKKWEVSEQAIPYGVVEQLEEIDCAIQELAEDKCTELYHLLDEAGVDDVPIYFYKTAEDFRQGEAENYESFYFSCFQLHTTLQLRLCSLLRPLEIKPIMSYWCRRTMTANDNGSTDDS